MTRRELLKGGAAMLAPALIRLPAFASGKSVRLAVIADVHHGLAPDATSRLESFIKEVRRREAKLDLAIQLGDFCHAGPDSKAFLDKWHWIGVPTLHVLGNHDLDKVDKATAVLSWGMGRRYGFRVSGGYRFIWLDLNNFKKDGKLHAYDKGNYFTEGASHNWADPEQLDWLASTLNRSDEPVVILSHQPLGFAQPGKPLPPEQLEVLSILTGSKKVALCLCGHMHVDRLEHHEGIPCYCVNSASYFWSGGMWPYTKPLFAFMEITSDGYLKVEGIAGEFAKPPPAGSDGVPGRSASISPRRILVSSGGV